MLYIISLGGWVLFFVLCIVAAIRAYKRPRPHRDMTEDNAVDNLYKSFGIHPKIHSFSEEFGVAESKFNSTFGRLMRAAKPIPDRSLN